MLLKKKICQFSLAAIVFACGSLFAASATLAQTPPPDPDAGDLVVVFTPDPLFNGSNFLPGDSATGEVKVTNGTTESKRIATETINYFGFPNSGNVPSDDLSRALVIVIREKGGSDIYGGSSPTGAKTLFEFYENGETYLSDVSAGGIEEYEFEISFPESKGDEWQGMTTKFDIVVGFQGEDGGIVPGTDPGGGGGSLPPGLTILDESIRVTAVGEDSATISWTTSYLSTSQVVYSSETEYNNGYTFDLAETNYGYLSATLEKDNTPPINEAGHGVTGHSVTIDGLASGTEYHFRCVSHASPPTISRSHSFTTLAMGDNMDNNDNIAGSTQASPPWVEDGANDAGANSSTQENGANDADNETDSEGSGLIPSVSKAINSIGNFIGSVLGLENTDKTGEDAVNSGAALENKAKGSFESSYDQTLFSLIILLLLIIVLLRYVYRFRIKKKKYIGDEDNISP